MEKHSHKILALKYRPKNFNELIGQDIMTQTISNSIKFGKIPNAYLLSGIRGVGKTTTARIIAKALNCKKNFDQEEKCESNEFCHCKEIANSRHLDVLEMDAASKTGIDDVRDLIESSKYNPTNAKYKIFIIDEIHMLSKQAFNGLLKTLEEPPHHLKFIFATTEVKKIPLTIISRCQRFDLSRVNINLLFQHLKKISEIENGDISDRALTLIAKASEGSVRDSLSLLDRALISQKVEKKQIDEAFIQKMLGIADRTRVIKLLQFIFNGDEKSSINLLRELINEGIEAKSLLNDFLEVIHFTTVIKSLGKVDLNVSVPETELENIEILSKKISSKTLVLFWQFIIKTLEELNIVNNQSLSLEMFIVRLLYLKGLPDYDEVLDTINKSSNNSEEALIGEKIVETQPAIQKTKISADQIKNVIQTKPNIKPEKPKSFLGEERLEKINSFEDLINCTSQKREIELKYDLEKNVNLVKFLDGQIDISFNDKLGKDFVRNLSHKLFQWTGKRWLISLTQEKGQKTYSEQMIENQKKIIELEKKNEIYEKFKKEFPDAALLEVKTREENHE